MKITESFEQHLSKTGSRAYLGQLRIAPGFYLGHRADVTPLFASSALFSLRSLAEVREWIKLDAAGGFRPVRGLKNLRAGWKMGPLSIRDLVEVLHLIYPGCVADYVFQQRNELPMTEFSETAARQTGMYRITQLLQPVQLEEMTRDVCDTVCVRKRLWQPVRPWNGAEGEIPVLCPEACNFLVGKAREKIKGKPAPE